MSGGLNLMTHGPKMQARFESGVKPMNRPLIAAQASLATIAIALIAAFAMPAVAKEEYWKPKCAEGAKLEQNKRKPEYRCARPGAMVNEYSMGKCKRPLKLRRVNGHRYNYMCQGTTIGSRGDPGTSESIDHYECRPGYEKNFTASKPTEACKRKVPGNSYEKPIF
jgi:hypothetical protein